MVETIDISQDQVVQFYHCGENSPYLTLRADCVEVHEDVVKVLNQEFSNPILTIHEYGYFHVVYSAEVNNSTQ